VSTELRWVEGPWKGKLAIAARPRGGDWLEGEIDAWHGLGITTIVSLLTQGEERELDLLDESAVAEARGIGFLSLPVPDRNVPGSESEVTAMLAQLHGILESGRNAVIHCRQGIGRAGLLASCMLIFEGKPPLEAIRAVSDARGVAIPETSDQRSWVLSYKVATAGTVRA
jgi:protein-tyrosine phosphatase